MVTGATDGIGKSYAEEVRVPPLIYFFPSTESTVTHHRRWVSLRGHGRESDRRTACGEGAFLPSSQPILPRTFGQLETTSEVAKMFTYLNAIKFMKQGVKITKHTYKTYDE